MLIELLTTWCILFGSNIVTTVTAGTEAEIIAALDEAAEEGTWGYVPLSGPYIDKQMSKNVTGQVGKTAVISCRILYIVGKTMGDNFDDWDMEEAIPKSYGLDDGVEYNGTYSFNEYSEEMYAQIVKDGCVMYPFVSWMRARDLHLLTVGRFTYTSDDRFKAVHQQGSDDWLLKIHYLQHRDGGAYECQVSTTPPMTHTVYLDVVDPTTWIVGGPDLYINLGSTINLTCEVKFSPEPPPYIFWYHNERLLSYDRDRNGVTVLTENTDGGSISRLIIEKATSNHSGRYNCSPATAPSHCINVHVIPMKDEEPAAIHHKNTTSSSSSPLSSDKDKDSKDSLATEKETPQQDISGSSVSSSSASYHLPVPPSSASSPILLNYFFVGKTIFITSCILTFLDYFHFSTFQFLISSRGYVR